MAGASVPAMAQKQPNQIETSTLAPAAPQGGGQWYRVGNTSSKDGKPGYDTCLIADLSSHMDKLLAYEDISHLLSDEQEKRLVDYVKAMLDMSHRQVSKRYSHWQEADRAHDVYVPPDTTDFREKAVIPDTRAIADTVLTYLMAALAGRNPMFQLEGLNKSSRQPALIMERVLHQQMRRTQGEARIAQLLLDSIRYGYAPTKLVWNHRTNQNNIINFDPRRAFHDPRVSWGDWESQQFVGFVDYTSYNALLNTGLYPKLKMFPALRDRAQNTPNRSGWDAHSWHREAGRGLSIDPAQAASRGASGSGHFKLGDNRVVDECWVRLAGYEIGVPQIDQIYLVLAVMDEDVVIRLQLNPYGQQFPTVFGSLYHDSHKTYGQSLYDVLLPMHDIATYLMRSRIDNITAALNNLIFVDPTQVMVPDLIDRNPWGVVRTLPGTKPGDGVFIAQIPDVTRGHLNDINMLSDMKQRVSAASDAQQGMPTSDGIRTATEIARLSQMGSQRLGVLSRVMSATTIRPLVSMMVANIQDSLAYEGSIKMDERNTPGALKPMIEDGYLDFDVTKLQGDIDYLIIDGTLPVEPTRSTETWMNMLGVINQTGLQMEYDAGQMAEEAIRSMGITDLERFRVSKEQQANPAPNQQIAMMQAMQGAGVMPNEQVQGEVQRGNLIPLAQAQAQRAGARQTNASGASLRT